jgi:hypothetical protein
MDWQLPITMLVILAAGSYVAFMFWRAWVGSKNSRCGGGCGCANASTEPKTETILIPAEQLKLRHDR